MLNTLQKDPFRLFFPMALLCLLYAALLWVFYALFDYGTFPLQKHTLLFAGGFLYFSILGFLFTAIPRFTSTEYMGKKELIGSSFLIFSVLLFYFLEKSDCFWVSIFTGFIYLIYFTAKRFVVRKQNPPYTFLFVATGIIFGLIGSFLLFLANFETFVFEALLTWGKIFFYDAMINSFILGVGARLIPGILGLSTVVESQKKIYEESNQYLDVIPKSIYFSLIIYVVSFILEALNFWMIGYLLRAIVISFFSFKYWRLHQRLENKKWNARMLKASCFILFITSWILVFQQNNSIHIKHLIYIGSYCLLTLLVSSRVILAHNKEGFELELKKSPYLVMGILVIFSALTRASAYLIPDSYVNHLGYAAVVLLTGTAFWIYYFFKRMFFSV
ncbi:MAG: NnrS family protein [Bacteriovoracaceae bacterium]|jgi:hypothetical protein|nr:NnrS family protein [Bacteriovoracaceae bacterium]